MQCSGRSSLLVVGFLLLVTGTYTMDVGSACPRSSSGVCRLIHDCPLALEQIRRTRQHKLERCGFQDLDEVVCCPEDEKSKESETTTSKTDSRSPTLRKSVQACEEYSNELTPDVEFQILGGTDAKLGEFPHMAGLGYESDDVGSDWSWDCGGSLISNSYILTAAHCVVRRDEKMPEKVRLGKIDISGNSDSVMPQDFNVAEIIFHPEYSNRNKVNDIALIRLSRKVQYTANVHPACLYFEPDDPKSVIITGWGLTEAAGNRSQILQKATLSTVPVTECNKTHTSVAFAPNVLRSHICAFTVDRQIPTDACQGDSGGPLQVLHKNQSSIYSIVGVTSYGRGCGSKYPGVYTRIYSYLDWIEGIVWS
ncbi:PREDICTED: serine protease persephone-like [Nicrophorus vespilloides]|uniref:Serine protease persephone-like n=1 Tax=Nicrophorus vespilloides TaxID=110193 RepID=A0ABM1NDQ1_NICVS|nr:PREDICTED: serine protease persephone-like [Nicrophorus vespilloides]